MKSKLITLLILTRFELVFSLSFNLKPTARYDILRLKTANSQTSTTSFKSRQYYAFDDIPSVSPPPPLTNVVLKISYDGTRFHGWSCANDGAKIKDSSTSKTKHLPLRGRGRSRRNRNFSGPPGRVRSVQGVIRVLFAKLYGDIDPLRVQVEGCSRTDGGVHASGMIAMVYCLKESLENVTEVERSTIPGKKIPHPIGPTDESFTPLPFQADLKQIMWVMNKMLPPDVRILNAAPTPMKILNDDSFLHDDGTSKRPFHPSLDSIAKTYRYTFSLGELHDPTRCRNIWHIIQNKSFDLEKTQKYAKSFCGTHDFKAFQGSHRGDAKDKVQDTVCTIHNLTIVEEGVEDSWCADGFSPLKLSSSQDLRQENYATTGIPTLCRTFCVTVIGDRFLYKMVRFLVGTLVAYGMEGGVLKNNETPPLLGLSGDVDNDHGDIERLRLTAQPRPCAPPHGLVLDKVHYSNEWQFFWDIGYND